MIAVVVVVIAKNLAATSVVLDHHRAVEKTALPYRPADDLIATDYDYDDDDWPDDIVRSYCTIAEPY